MFDVVLYQPEIAPNTGNIIRLCANSGCGLHLIHPLGFRLDDRRLKRAGLDYREWTRIEEHDGLDAFIRSRSGGQIYCFTTRGSVPVDRVAYAPGDALLFGPETRGLPPALLAATASAQQVRIPMLPSSRSLNLANAVAIAVYEAWRQHHYALAATSSPFPP